MSNNASLEQRVFDLERLVRRLTDARETEKQMQYNTQQFSTFTRIASGRQMLNYERYTIETDGVVLVEGDLVIL